MQEKETRGTAEEEQGYIDKIIYICHLRQTAAAYK